MVEFRRKQIDNTESITVVSENLDGTETKKILDYKCPLKNIIFTNKLMALSDELNNVSGLTSKDYQITGEIIKNMFELMAPGKWDEYLDLFDGDIIEMTELAGGMADIVIKKGIESKQTQIETVVPVDAEAI